MAITRLQLENFTAFESLDMELSPGINVLVGANGTGKTHIMKVCYAACEYEHCSTVWMELFRDSSPICSPTGRILESNEDLKIALHQAKVGIYFKDRPPIEVDFSDEDLAIALHYAIGPANPIECCTYL